jgi:hypothetical protein
MQLDVAFLRVPERLAEARATASAHRGPLSRDQQDGLYLDTAWRGCTDMQQPNHTRR